jgi:hypothetical protein
MRSWVWLVVVLGAVGVAAAVYVSPGPSIGSSADIPPAQNPLGRVLAQVSDSVSSTNTEAMEEQAEAAEPAPPEKPLSLFPEGKLEGAKARLCYFSFNNPREYATTKRLVAHLNANSPIQIEVVEFVQDDANIKKSLLAAMRSGTQCDGIVLSGHHRGKFWGDRSSGSMKAGFLEEQSCTVQNAAWFAHVKAVWLEGCNTGRQNLMNPEIDPEDKIHGSPLNYIRAHLKYDDFDDSLDDITDAFDENLNEDNLAKEYMRIFPYATVMGWTDMAPGEKAGSHYSFPYFLAQIVRIVDEDPRFLQNPMRGQLSSDSARRYSEALYSVLTRDPYGSNADGRPEILAKEDTYIKAWRDHSNVKYPFAFDNPSIAGYRSLVNNDNELLRQSTAMRCVMEQDDDSEDTAGGTVSYLLRNKTLTPIASQLLLAIGQGSPALRKQIAESESLLQYLRHAKAAPDFQEFRRAEAETFLGLLSRQPEAVAQKEQAGTSVTVE